MEREFKKGDRVIVANSDGCAYFAEFLNEMPDQNGPDQCRVMYEGCTEFDSFECMNHVFHVDDWQDAIQQIRFYRDAKRSEYEEFNGICERSINHLRLNMTVLKKA